MSPEGEITELGEGRSCLDRTVGVGFMEEVGSLSLEGWVRFTEEAALGGRGEGGDWAQTPPGPTQSHCWYS